MLAWRRGACGRVGLGFEFELGLYGGWVGFEFGIGLSYGLSLVWGHALSLELGLSCG